MQIMRTTADNEKMCIQLFSSLNRGNSNYWIESVRIRRFDTTPKEFSISFLFIHFQNRLTEFI